MAILTDAHNLARTLLGERQTPPEVFNDTFLLGLSPEIYREIQRRLAAAGVAQLKDYAVFNVAIATLSVTDGAVGYPLTVIKPRKLWERDQASVLFADYVEMEEAWPSLIPRAAVTALVHWEWKNKTLYFVGGLGARTIRMEFAKYLADLTAVGDTLAIPDCMGALAYGTAAAAARSRGSGLAADLDTVFEGMVQKLIERDMGRATGA
jgi:hypothetical protein